MNILYFTNIPSPYKIGFLNTLNKNAKVTCIFTKNIDDKRDSRWFSDIKIDFDYYNIKSGDFLSLTKVFKQNKYDVGISGTYATFNGVLFANMCKKYNIRYFINADGGFPNYNDSFMSKFLKSHFLQKADYCLSSGKETNKYLTYYGVKESNIYTYPFTSLFKEDILTSPLSYEEKMLLRKQYGYDYKRLFISVGNFIYRKGYDLFLNAIEDLKFDDTAFIIIGSGHEKGTYIDFIKQNNIKNVFLIDFCQKKELFNYLKMSDIFFFPSREDIWGLVINEAMANGLPIISGDNVIASKELLDNKFLFNTNNLQEHRQAIVNINSLNNEELYRIGQSNIDRIKDYTIENMTKVHLNVFNEVLNGK